MSVGSHEIPIDVARQINAEATDVDGLMKSVLVPTSEDNQFINTMLGELQGRHPLLGREVIAYGKQLTSTMRDLFNYSHNGAGYGENDEEEDDVTEDTTLLTVPDQVPYAMPPEDKTSRVLGYFIGFGIRTVYYPEVQAFCDEVVNVVQTGEYNYMDEFGSSIRKITYADFCVSGSELVPVLPIGAHSLDELKNDKFIQEVDQFVADPEIDRIRRLQGVVDMFNSMCAKESDPEVTDLIHQRVSYINSLGLLDNLVITTDELALVDRSGEPPYAIESGTPVVSLTQVVQFDPYFLFASPSYLKLSDEEVKSGYPVKLFAARETNDDKIMLVRLDKKPRLEIQEEPNDNSEES